jgi:hypothetical protein
MPGIGLWIEFWKSIQPHDMDENTHLFSSNFVSILFIHQFKKDFSQIDLDKNHNDRPTFLIMHFVFFIR